MKLSVIATVYNEQNNIIPFYEKLTKSLKNINYELLIIDDGSNDSSKEIIKSFKDKKVKKIFLQSRRGKSFALYEGIKESTGEIIATIDADLQDEPHDIPLMIKELKKGYDLIDGWRFDRKDGPVKLLCSRIGNFFNNIIMGLSLHDNTCPVKVFRRVCIKKVLYFDNFHRFIPIMVKKQGFKINSRKL